MEFQISNIIGKITPRFIQKQLRLLTIHFYRIPLGLCLEQIAFLIGLISRTRQQRTFSSLHLLFPIYHLLFEFKIRIIDDIYELSLAELYELYMNLEKQMYN